MSPFWGLVAVLSAAALAFVVPPLLGRGRRPGADRDRINAAIYRERLAELDEEFPPAERGGAEHARARAELLKALARETRVPTEGDRPREGASAPLGAVLIAAALPAGALLLYLTLGEPSLFLAPAPTEAATADASGAGATGAATPSVRKMVARLERRLADRPHDVDGWLLLARSYTELDQLPRAREALGRALDRNPGQPDLVVAQAETLGRIQGNRLTGKPLALLHQVLEESPEHRKALWLAGIGEMQAGRPARALELWDRLRAAGPMPPDDARLLDRFVAEARSALAGGGSGAASASGSPSPGQAPPADVSGTPAQKGRRLAVRVELAPGLSARAAPTDTVFVFARAARGPRMPLAIVKRTVAELPLTVELDDSMAMVPAMRLSAFDEVVVEARVSHSGNAAPASGDLVGESDPIARTGSPEVHVEIASVVP